MDRFYYFIAGCMIVVGLLISGCRKDTWDDIDVSSSNHAVFKGYHPVFDTIPNGTNGFSGIQNAQILAPTTVQIAEMKIAYDNIPYGSPLSLKIGQISVRGQVIDINHSMIQRSDDPDRYVISMPFIRNGEVESMIYYYHTDAGTGTFLLLEKQEVIQEIQNNCSSVSANLPLFAMIVGRFNTTQLKLDSTYNSTINNWLSRYLENRHETGNIVSRDIIKICDYTFYATPIAHMNCGCEMVEIFVNYDCYSFGGGGDIFHDFGDPSFGTEGQPKGGKADGDSEGSGSDDEPILIGECWNNLSQQAQQAITDVMKSYYSPCPDEQAAIDNAIQDVISDICAEINEKGKVLGIGYEALNLDKSTVTHRVMNKLNDKIEESLDGVDYIKIDKSLNDCELIKCGIKNALGVSQSNMCNIIQELQQSKVSYIIKLGEVKDFPNNNTAAITRFDLETGTSGIDFNPNFCKSLHNSSQFDKINMVLAFTHELLHIHLNNLLVQIYKQHGKSLPMSKNFVDDFNLLLAEEQYCVETIQGKHGQHVIMGKKFVNDFATALWESNGKIGVPDDYLWFAWQGLYQDGITPESYMTKSQHDKLYERFINNVGIDKLNIKCN